MDITDIHWMDLMLGYGLLVLPILIFWYYETGLVMESLIAIVRMTIQLIIIGLYLEFIFETDSVLLNIGWVILMITVATYTVSTRSELNRKYFLLPVLLATLGTIMIVDAFFLGFVIKLENAFTARYFIPITGMILGNILKSNIIALNSFYGDLHNNMSYYHYALGNGATRSEALKPFMRKSLKQAFNPTIATMAVVGIISLPGMMTGQILSGSDPNLAVKYQIMIMITIFVTGTVSTWLTIKIANTFVFDDFDNPVDKLIRETK